MQFFNLLFELGVEVVTTEVEVGPDLGNGIGLQLGSLSCCHEDGDWEVLH